MIEENSCSGSSGAYGGGIYLQVPAVVENNNVLYNTAISQNHEALGGGISFLKDDAQRIPLTMNNNTFKFNSAKSFEENQSAFGGGLAVSDALLEMKDNIIERNYLASLHHNFGGGAYLDQLQENSRLLNNQFNANMTYNESSGKANDCIGGGLLLMNNSKVLLKIIVFETTQPCKAGP